jgi:hypothetical protein
MNTLSLARWRECGRALAAAAVFGMMLLQPGSDVFAQARLESLERPGGQRVEGKLVGDARSGFAFVSKSGAAKLALEPGSVIHFDGSSPDVLATPAPFRVLAGEALRLSGAVKGISPTAVRLAVSWQPHEVILARPGVQAVVQRPGEARVLVDGFEALDRARWTVDGKVAIVKEPHLGEGHSVNILAGGASLSHRLEEPQEAGRFELAFYDGGSVVAGHKWFAELAFQGPSGGSVVRVVLGWSEESLAVESPNGPSLAVQRLARTPGWHRFVVVFGPDHTEMSVDGKELAHGKGPDGPLVTIRLASSGPATSARAEGVGPPPGLPSGYVEDLQLIKFAEPPASLEFDIKQDEARMVVGDQAFGTVTEGDGDTVRMVVEGQPMALSWSQVAGLYFRRVPVAGAVVEGLLARIEWRSPATEQTAVLDFAEGAIVALSEKAATLATPYSGVLAIPRDLIRTITVFGLGRRLVIDPAAHHMGDELSTSAPVLDPPQPEGDVLERTVDLTEVPGGPWSLIFDVIEVVGETSDPIWSPRVRAGELRTYVSVNDRRIDYLNRHIKTQNKSPERVAIAIPPGLLHRGKNKIRIELTSASGAKELDDLGILQIALERASGAGASPRAPTPGAP